MREVWAFSFVCAVLDILPFSKVKCEAAALWRPAQSEPEKTLFPRQTTGRSLKAASLYLWKGAYFYFRLRGAGSHPPSTSQRRSLCLCKRGVSRSGRGKIRRLRGKALLLSVPPSSGSSAAADPADADDRHRKFR